VRSRPHGSRRGTPTTPCGLASECDRDKVAYLREHRWRTWGLGASVAVFLVIPGLNVVGLAVGAVGATLRSLELERAAKERAALTATTRS
jgi:hypothetical protein